MTEREKLRLLKLARDQSGLPLDFWDQLTEGLDSKAFAILCGRSFLFPKYMKSKVSP